MPIRAVKMFDHLTIDARGRNKVTLNIPITIVNQSGSAKWYKLYVTIDNNVFESAEKYIVEYGTSKMVLFSVDITPPPVSDVVTKNIVLTIKEFADARLSIQTDYMTMTTIAHFLGDNVEVMQIDDFEGSFDGWTCSVTASLATWNMFAGGYALRVPTDRATTVTCTRTYYTNVLGYRFYVILRVKLMPSIRWLSLRDDIGGHYITFYPTYWGYWIEMASKLEPDTANNLLRAKLLINTTAKTEAYIDYVEWIRAPI